MKVAGYIRVSTDEQANSGLGLEAQKAKIEAYCSLYEHELVTLYSDSASGKNLKREGLQAALKALQNGEVEGLIIAKLDRLTRSVKDMGTLLETYFEKKHTLICVGEQVDTSTAAGRLVLNVLMSVAQWERETIGERTKDALKAKKVRGEKTGGDVPFGYQVTEEGKLVEDPQEQAIIRQIKTLQAKGYGLRKIANALNEEGYTTKHGKEWKDMQVKRVLERIANG